MIVTLVSLCARENAMVCILDSKIFLLLIVCISGDHIDFDQSDSLINKYLQWLRLQYNNLETNYQVYLQRLIGDTGFHSTFSVLFTSTIVSMLFLNAARRKPKHMFQYTYKIMKYCLK